MKLPEYQRARTVFCFLGGIDTRIIPRDALAQGKILYVPLCTGDGVMEARRIEGLEQLTPGAYGILEPPPEAPLRSGRPWISPSSPVSAATGRGTAPRLRVRLQQKAPAAAGAFCLCVL